MEKKLNILFYKDIKSNQVRAFIDRYESSGKSFSIIQYQESMVENSQYSQDEKKAKKEQIMINHYLTLLENGYSISQITKEINKGISMAEKEADLEKVINQLKIELLLAEKANLLFLDSTSKKQVSNEINIEPQPIDEVIADLIKNTKK